MNTRRFAEGERVKEERRPPEPAPLPLHALLRMQQGAGNQAVGRILARVKVHKKTREGLEQTAMTTLPAPTTGEEVLLRMLNAYGASIKPKARGPWQDSATAIGELKSANKFDDGDEKEFKAVANTRFPPEQGAAVVDDATKNLIAKERPAVEGKFSDHIFKGITKSDGEPGGYHSINGASPTHEAFGTPTELEKGVYQRSVRFIADTTHIKKTQSTFFPDAATKDEVLDGVTSVMGVTGRKKGVMTISYPTTLKGIRLQQIDDETIFPAGGGPLTGEGWMSKGDREKAKKQQKKTSS